MYNKESTEDKLLPSNIIFYFQFNPGGTPHMNGVGMLVVRFSTATIPLARHYKGNGYKLSAQRFLGLFGWTSVSYDWLMVLKATINQSQVKKRNEANVRRKGME